MQVSRSVPLGEGEEGDWVELGHGYCRAAHRYREQHDVAQAKDVEEGSESDEDFFRVEVQVTCGAEGDGDGRGRGQALVSHEIYSARHKYPTDAISP